jgi:hypothetical protein
MKPPKPPVAFRPPKAAQPQRGNVFRKPPAPPPVYRPQPTPKVLQTKTTPHTASAPRRTLPQVNVSAPRPPVPNRTARPNVRAVATPPQPHRVLQAQTNGVNPRVNRPQAFSPRASAVQLSQNPRKPNQSRKLNKTLAATKRKGQFKKTPTSEEQKQAKRAKQAAALKAKRAAALNERRGIKITPSTHKMKLRYEHRDNVLVRPDLDETVVREYVLLALANFHTIVAEAGKFVKKQQVVNAGRLDNLAFGVSAKFGVQDRFVLLNCVAIAERPDGVTIIAVNRSLPLKARMQLDKMFPKGFILLECTRFAMKGLHCEIKLWEDVDDFEQLPFGVQQLCCLYCAAQLVAVGVTNFAGCHGQTYGHTNISTVVVGQPGPCRKLLGAKVYAWYEKLKTDEQRQFISALECGGSFQRLSGQKTKKVGKLTYSNEARTIHDVTGQREMTLRTDFDHDDDYHMSDEDSSDSYEDPRVMPEDFSMGIIDVDVPHDNNTTTTTTTTIRKKKR